MTEAQYKEYYKIARNASFKILKNRCDAEDVAHNVLIKYIKTQKETDNPKAWLRKVARNTAIDICRHKKRNVETPFHKMHEPSFSHVEKYTHEERQNLSIAWEALSDEHKTILYLHIVNGLPHSEIAKIIKIKHGTCMSRTYYAMKELKHNMGITA